MDGFQTDDEDDEVDGSEEMGVDAEDGDEADSIRFQKLAAQVHLYFNSIFPCWAWLCSIPDSDFRILEEVLIYSCLDIIAVPFCVCLIRNFMDFPWMVAESLNHSTGKGLGVSIYVVEDYSYC